MFEVNFKQTITPKQVADLMVGAFEGGSNSWINSIDYKKIPVEVVPNGIVTYSHPEFWGGDFVLVVETFDEDDALKVITPDTLSKGIQLMAEQHPKAFWDWIEEQDDAATSDLLLQLTCFGEVVYG